MRLDRIVLTSLALICAVGVSGGRAQDTSVTVLSGNDLHKLCTSSSGIDQLSAATYVAGVVDAAGVEAVMLGANFLMCVPTGTTGGQLRDIVCKNLAAKPATRHGSAGVLAYAALLSEFPCHR